jgi:hypothetical protein
MPSSKKPRKKKSQAVFSLPITIRHSGETETALQLAPHAELLKFREGLATEESWHTIVARLNVGLVAIQQNRGQTKVVETGLKAMLKVKERNEKTGKWLLSGQDYKEIGLALGDTDSIQLSVTRKQFAQAIRYVYETAAIK